MYKGIPINRLVQVKADGKKEQRRPLHREPPAKLLCNQSINLTGGPELKQSVVFTGIGYCSTGSSDGCWILLNRFFQDTVWFFKDQGYF